LFGKLAAVMLSALASVLVFVAHIGVGPCCWIVYYEPDIPESLKTQEMM